MSVRKLSAEQRRSRQNKKTLKKRLSVKKRPRPTDEKVAHAPPRRSDVSPGALVGFGSLKGGVGKTTFALCAAELLRTGGGRTSKTQPVVVIDADIAGTELYLVWGHRCGSSVTSPTPDYEEREVVSLLELLNARPDDTETLNDLVAAAQRLVNAAKPKVGAARRCRGLVVPTFPPGDEEHLEALLWKETLELTGSFVTVRLAEVLERLCRTGCAVVVDLPAFDVGFAHQAAEALKLAARSLKQKTSPLFLVTDCDIRSLRTTYTHLRERTEPERANTLWENVVVNRAPDASWRSEFFKQLERSLKWSDASYPVGDRDKNKVSRRRPIVAAGMDGIRLATMGGGSPRELMNAIGTYLSQPRISFLDDDDRRRLCGEPIERSSTDFRGKA